MDIKNGRELDAMVTDAIGLTPEQEERLDRILNAPVGGHEDMHHMTCDNCGLDLGDLDPMTVTALWDSDVLYLSFECGCSAAYEIRLPPEVLRETMEEVCP